MITNRAPDGANKNLHFNSCSVSVCQQRNKTCQLQGLAGWAGDETRGVSRGRILPWSSGWKSWPGDWDKTQSNIDNKSWILRCGVSTVMTVFQTGKTSNNRPWLHTLSKLKPNSFLIHLLSGFPLIAVSWKKEETKRLNHPADAMCWIWSHFWHFDNMFHYQSG